jgi:hypothetical protein
MASSEDFKRILELYNQESKASGVSIVNFCKKNGIVFSQFERGYKNRHNVKVHAVDIVDKNGSYHYMTVGTTNNSLLKVVSSDVDGGMYLQEIKFKDTTPNMDNAIKFAKQDTNNSIYTDVVVFSTTPAMDKNIMEEAQQMKNKIDTKEIKYNVFKNNCADAVQQVLEKALGIDMHMDVSFEPNEVFESIKKNSKDIQNEIDKKKTGAK